MCQRCGRHPPVHHTQPDPDLDGPDVGDIDEVEICGSCRRARNRAIRTRRLPQQHGTAESTERFAVDPLPNTEAQP
jgi:hypothetical protein